MILEQSYMKQEISKGQFEMYAHAATNMVSTVNRDLNEVDTVEAYEKYKNKEERIKQYIFQANKKAYTKGDEQEKDDETYPVIFQPIQGFEREGKQISLP
ncbi:hypothetical protein [Priestia aryabhattai]